MVLLSKRAPSTGQGEREGSKPRLLPSLKWAPEGKQTAQNIAHTSTQRWFDNNNVEIDKKRLQLSRL